MFIKQNVVFLMLYMSDWIGCLLSNFSESDCRITVLDMNSFLLSKLQVQLDSYLVIPKVKVPPSYHCGSLVGLVIVWSIDITAG